MRKLILEKLAELDLTMGEASRRIGKNAAYMQQFLKRGIPRELGENERTLLAELIGVDESSLRGPSASILPVRSYQKTADNVAPPQQDFRTPDNYRPPLDNDSPKPPIFGTANDLPVFGTAQGGDGGSLVMSNEAVDWVLRPAPLLRVKDGYGIIVTGDSMSPQHENGSTALVNPHLPPRNGNTCVFRQHRDDGSVYVIIKKLRRFTDDTWFLSQFNPAKDFTLKRADWQICHVTIGNYFP